MCRVLALLAGFWLAGCLQDYQTIVYACEGVECGGHGVCKLSDGGPVCLCDDGYLPFGLECHPDLYVSCSGTPFTPACEDLACVEGEEDRYFDLFRDELCKILKEDRGYLQEHIFVNDVEIKPHADNRIFRVDFLFIYDWLRIRTNAEVRRLDPFSEQDFREQITTPGFGIELTRKYSAPVELDEVVSAIHDCGGTLELVDWCHILRFGNVEGDLVVSGLLGIVDYLANQCTCILMNLETGDYECQECACWYD
jgi:hypothetical protein